jgi:hypothetical protein
MVLQDIPGGFDAICFVSENDVHENQMEKLSAVDNADCFFSACGSDDIETVFSEKGGDDFRSVAFIFYQQDNLF